MMNHSRIPIIRWLRLQQNNTGGRSVMKKVFKIVGIVAAALIAVVIGVITYIGVTANEDDYWLD